MGPMSGSRRSTRFWFRVSKTGFRTTSGFRTNNRSGCSVRGAGEKKTFLIEVAICLVSDDGRALGHVGAEPARMIEVVMGVHEIANRLVE